MWRPAIRRDPCDSTSNVVRLFLRAISAIAIVSVVALSLAALLRIVRVNKAAAAIPVYPGTREGGGRTRYLPHLLSWDDRSSARVKRTQRMYGGVFPAEFLDAPMVIEWSWALGGPRSPRPAPAPSPILREIPPPRPRG